MNRDYSKFLELLNKDAEKERNENAEKAVHDNLYNKGFRDGSAVLDKIKPIVAKWKMDTWTDNLSYECMAKIAELVDPQETETN